MSEGQDHSTSYRQPTEEVQGQNVNLGRTPGRNLKDESVRGTKRAIFLRGGVERMKRVSKFRISYGVLEKGQFS